MKLAEELDSSNKKKYIVLLGCMLAAGVLQGIINNCFPLYIIPVTEDFGWLRSQYTLAQTFSFGAQMIGSAISWRVYRKFGLLRTVRVTAGIASLCYMSYSIANTLAGFYIRASIVGLCLGLSSVVPIALIVRKWFETGYSTAVGIAMMGSGLGGALFNIITENVLASFGWRRAYLILGVVLLVLAEFASIVLIRDKANTVPAKGSTRTEAKLPRKTATIVFVCLLLTMFGQGNLLYNMIPYFQDIGYSEAFAARISSCNFFILAFGKILQGRLIDRKGARFTVSAVYISLIVSIVSLILFKASWMLALVWMGTLLATPTSTVLAPSLAGVLFDEELRPKAVGLFNAATSAGLAMMPTFGSISYDFFGSYAPFFALSVALCVGVWFAMDGCLKHSR